MIWFLSVRVVCTNYHSHLGIANDGLHLFQLEGLSSQGVTVSEKQNAFSFSHSTFRWLNPLAPAGARPQTPQEADRPILDVRAIMTTHDWLDGFRGLVCVVEWDGADVVVKDVGFNDTVEESAADETEFTIDCCSSSTNIVPASSCVVRKSWVSVLEVGNSN